MQTGRMKGQAFVSLPDDKATSKALQETNGFVLHGKPMVVVREILCFVLVASANCCTLFEISMITDFITILAAHC